MMIMFFNNISISDENYNNDYKNNNDNNNSDNNNDNNDDYHDDSSDSGTIKQELKGLEATVTWKQFG